MSKTSITVLLTCGGGPGTLVHLFALKRSTKYDARVILADANAASGNLFLPEVDARFRIPSCTSSDFVPALCRLIVQEKIDYLYSGLDEEIPVIAEYRAQFEALGCRVLVPLASSLRVALDKAATYHQLMGRVRMPPTVFVDDKFDADATWRAVAGKPVVKTTALRGGRHVYICEDREEYEFAVRRARRLQEAEGLPFMVQGYIEGDEYNVTTLHRQDGGLVFAFSRRKFETRKIKSTTIAAVVERRDDVIEMATEAVEALGLAAGFNNVEIIVSRVDGQPYFIEVNGGRTAAQDMNIFASGVNLTELMIDLLRGEAVGLLPHIPDGLATLKIRQDVPVAYSDIDRVPLG